MVDITLDDERELIFDRLVDAVVIGLRHGVAKPPDEDVVYVHAAMAVACVLRRMRVLSGRQLAVTLATEANRHESWVIKEPPEYKEMLTDA